MKKKLTPKQKTLKEYPNAYCFYHDFYKLFMIETPSYDTIELGCGSTRQAAWKDASKRLEEKK